MISKYALQDFFKSGTQDYSSLKKYTKKQVWKELAYLGVDYKFKTEPRLNQLIGFLIGQLEDAFLFYYYMGTGKTKTVLDLIQYKKQQGSIKKALFIVAGPSAVLDITQQVSLHTDLTGLGLLGNCQEKWEQLQSFEEDVVVVNYQSLIWLCCTLVEQKKKKKNKQTVNLKKVRQLQNLFQFIVFDEIFMCQNSQSITFKVCKHLAKGMKYKYGLTGTPVGKNPQSFWTQFFLMDSGDTLGHTLGMFREYYFTTKRGYFGGYEHKFIKDKEQHLQRRLLNKSLPYTLQELGEELPPIIRQEYKITMPEEVRQVYKDVLNGMRSDFLGGAKLKNNFMKLRQLCSSLLWYVNEEEERKLVRFSENPKLEACMELVEQIPKGCKALIFYEFTPSGELLEHTLMEKKIKCKRLHGGTKDKNIVKTFTSSKTLQVLILQNQAGATSLNLQCANYVMYYESTIVPVTRQQQEARVHRMGQNKTTFFYDFVVLDSAEEKIKQYLQEGKELSASLFIKEAANNGEV